MTWRRCALTVAAIAASFTLAACGGGPPPVESGDPVLEAGRDVYARNCASCHGRDGGGGLGRKLSEGAVVAAFPSIDEQIELIANGKGTMPAYVARLSDDELRAVARYTREVL